MAEATTHGLRRVSDDEVWSHLKTLFLGALALFLVNIALGFMNAVTAGDLPRWQTLTHLHGGAIGWITLSVIGIGIWLVTGGREVSAAYASRVHTLVWAGIIVFAGYIASFGISFYLFGNAMYLLPVFGTAAALVIWVATAFVLTEIRRVPVVTTTHLMVTGGLIVASVGALLGVFAGLEQALGHFLPIEEGEIVSVHRGPMEIYVLILGAGLVEWIALNESAESWGYLGMAQAVLWGIAALSLPVGIFIGVMPLVIIGFMIGILAFPLLFAVRMGWRALLTNPLEQGVDAWGFFGTIGLIAFPILFFTLGETDAAWGLPVVFHIFFVGMMTNLLFGVLSAATEDARSLHALAEPTAMWGLNLGLVVFIATRIALDTRLGAAVMGLAVLVGVAEMMFRLTDQSAGRRQEREPLGAVEA
jgi:hypothetical protein